MCLRRNPADPCYPERSVLFANRKVVTRYEKSRRNDIDVFRYRDSLLRPERQD